MSDLELLVEKAKACQLVLLVGVDLPSAGTGLPSGKELAHGLAEQAHLAPSDSLATVAQVLHDRTHQHLYYNYLQQTLTAGEPGPLHRAVARLPVPYLVTTAYDDRLARALEAANRPPNLLVKDDDVKPRSFDLAHPDLVKLCGDPQHPGTLVVARAEYERLYQDDDRRELLRLVGEWLAEKTLLMVGYDPAQESDFTDWLYWEVLKRLGGFGAGGYLAWPNPAQADVDAWQGRDVTVIDQDPLTLLQALAEELEGAEITPPKDKAQAAFERFAQLLTGTPTEAEITAALDQVPAERRPTRIRTTFRLWLSDADDVQSIFNVDPNPDIWHHHGLPNQNTGISLQALKEWSTEAEEAREEREERPQDGLVQTQGIAFFDKILPPNSKDREAYKLALTMSQVLNAELTIVFELQDERDLGRLAPVPWELLHDGQVGFLGLKYPVYRLPHSVSSIEQVTGRIRKALIVAAGKLQALDAEVDWLDQALQGANVQVDRCVNVDDPEIVKDKIRDGGYDLLHFVGHGQFNAADPSQSKLLLGRPRQQDKVLTAAALAEVARESQLVLVFLSACEGGEEAALAESQPWKEAGIVDGLIRAGVPAAVGMRWEIGDENSRKLAQRFYEQLLSDPGQPPERALMRARQALETQPDWANPVLTKRHGVLSGGA